MPIHYRGIAVLVCLTALLPACGQSPGSTSVTRETVNGVDVIHSMTRQQDGKVLLDCKASRSGLCHYRIQNLPDCKALLPSAPQASCEGGGELHAALSTGTHWEFTTSARVVVCVSDVPGKPCPAP